MKVILLIISILLPAISFAENLSAVNAYDFSFKNVSGEKVDLSKYKGKLVLLVKDEDFCGFTRGLFALNNLTRLYRDRGLEILVVSSQESMKKCPGRTNWVKYPVVVPEGGEFNSWLVSASSSKGNPTQVLISPFGNVIEAYNTNPAEDSSDVRKDIEYNLPEAPVD
ncbi:MAG: redoxin domain-containing protein [Alphaproteobacteria bacterium]|nr:redoxin domain-containing protein [Alphaproteobacteria bacterium]OJV11981.1 MAG: hypothetical protein BGO27_06405 [Alphaproteobacteria bacterium 33-17]